MQISSKINVQFIKTLDKNWINYQELCSKEEHHVKCAIKEGFFLQIYAVTNWKAYKYAYTITA